VKIGVLSDTHGNLDYMRRALGHLRGEFGAERFYHLGDEYGDCDEMLDEGLALVRVPGIYAVEYASGRAPKALADVVEGRTIVLVHQISDVSEAQRASADLVVHGHTHKAGVSVEGGAVIFNPGHLKSARHKNHPASFGALEVEAQRVRVRVLGMDFSAILEMELPWPR